MQKIEGLLAQSLDETKSVNLPKVYSRESIPARRNQITRDRVNAEIVHFYAEKIQKMHFQNFNASWDAGRLFVLDHFILNKTKRSEVEISRPQSEVEISWPPYWNEQRRRLGTILKHPGVLHAYPPF